MIHSIVYKPKEYLDYKEDMIVELVCAEGFSPIKIVDAPGKVYYPHKHPETKLLVFLSGDVEVAVGEETFHCSKGDKLIIPGNTEHSALVGKNGCTFFWSEKLV